MPHDDYKEFGFDDSEVFQNSLGSLDVYADIVYCIDITSSMKPVIDKVKETALTLHEDLQSVMQTNYQRTIKQLRIKIIGFRDAYCDGRKSFEISPFFTLPYENDEFKKFVDKLAAKGGGDIPENSLEALALAMKSDWCRTLDSSIRKRHIIVLFTDAPYHPLEKSLDGKDDNYPAGMPANYSELIDWWSDQSSLASGTGCEMDQVAKRIAFFVPKVITQWKDASNDFDSSICIDIEPDNGGSDISTEKLLKLLGETMV